MWLGKLLAAFLLVLSYLLLGATGQQYNCPTNALQLITDAQVTQGDIVNGSNFNEVLSVSSFVTLYWPGSINQVPNNGTWTFNEPYVIIGLTSTGEYVGGSERYVSSFSLSYSKSLNTSFQNISMSSIVNTPNEVGLFFNEPILAQRLRVYIQSAIGSPNYYWRLNLIGCPLVNASFEGTPSSSLISCTSSIEQSPVVTSSFDSFISSMSLISESSSVCSCQPPVTETVFLNDPNTVSSSNCQGSITAAIVVPLLLLILLLVAGVLIIFGIFKLKNKQYSTERKPVDIPMAEHTHTKTAKENLNIESYAEIRNNTTFRIAPATTEESGDYSRPYAVTATGGGVTPAEYEAPVSINPSYNAR